MLAVTGIGLISPHGNDPQEAFSALVRGESEIQQVDGESFPPAAAARVQFDPSRWFTRLQLAGVDRVSQLAVAAADLAIADADMAHRFDPERAGVFVGCGMGGATALETAYVVGVQGGRVPPLTIPAFMLNAPAAHVAMRLGVTGPVLTYSVACASSAIAIAEAAKAICCGDLDIAIAGGSEALIIPGVIRAWQAMQTLAKFEHGAAASSCRPFSLDRSGFALGEGAAFLVLEPVDSARNRGARRYAELIGWGIGCDATHLTKPDAEGQQRALRGALRQAELSPNDVGYYNAHGTATKIGDVVESEALHIVWGDQIDRLRVSSTKSMHGHLLGAAGSLEAAIAVLALYHRRLPPNAFCTRPDPSCQLNLVSEPGEEAPGLNAAISSSFAFGGTNAVLAFGRA